MTEPRFGYGTFAGWLKAQMALLPLIILAGSAAIVLADSHYDKRYQSEEDGQKIETKVDKVQTVVTDVQKAQAVSDEKIQNIDETVQDLKSGQESIESKLDRLIERQH